MRLRNDARAGGPDARHHAAAVLLTASALMSLASCSAAGAGHPGSASAGAAAARESVAELVHDITGGLHDDIGSVARAVVESEERGTILLIGIHEKDAPRLIDTFGRLEFLVPPPEGGSYGTEDPDATSHCFSVSFNHYGKDGDWGTDGVDPIECPDDAAGVVPPADETVYEVIASNAEEVVYRILSQLPSSGEAPSADGIAAAINAELSDPAGDNYVAAPSDVVVEGSRVGVAMGYADDCLLVGYADGTITRVHVPPMLLQPGELGCNATTALADAEQLRPPH